MTMERSAIEPASRSRPRNLNRAARKLPFCDVTLAELRSNASELICESRAYCTTRSFKRAYVYAQHDSCFNTIRLFDMRGGLCRDGKTLSDPLNHIRKERV
jgi:hypothetical protein